MTIITVSEAKIPLALEPDFKERDGHITTLIEAAQRSIERNYYCTLVSTQAELDALPDGSRGFIADEDIKLAVKMLVTRWYFDPVAANTEIDTSAKLGVEWLLFTLTEHTV